MFGLTGHRAGKIDLAGMQQRGILVCYTDGGPGVESTAELALGLMLAAARRIPQGDASVRAGRFQLDTPTGFVLAGKTLGLVGLGRIGAQMARYGTCARHERPRVEPEPDGRSVPPRPGASVSTRRAPRPSRRREPASRAVARTRGMIGAAEIARDEARRDPRQHVARAARSTKPR